MRVYNVELFDKDYNYINHGIAQTVNYTKDYLSVQKNHVNVSNFTLGGNGEIKNAFYVKISAAVEIVGVVCAVTASKNSYTITYKDLITLFNTNIKVDVTQQGVGTLEAFIKKHVEENYVNNSDTLQNIKGLTVKVNSGVTSWSFNFKSEREKTNVTFVNLLEDVIIRSFKKYRVALIPKVDFLKKTFTVSIEQDSAKPFYIESDLNNVTEKRFSVTKNAESVNKLVIFNRDNYDEKAIYYLHTNGNYDTTNSDRVVPVVPLVMSLNPRKTEKFTTEAQKQADDTFTSNKFNHYIELGFAVKTDIPLEIGRKYKIIRNDEFYDTVLTGYTISSDVNVKMRFGNARVKLSKMLERGLR